MFSVPPVLIRVFLSLVLVSLLQCFSTQVSADTIALDHGEFAYDQSSSIPPLGWARTSLPLHVEFAPISQTVNSGNVIWFKLPFNRKQIGPGSIAILIAQSGGSIDAYMNAAPFFHSFSSLIEQNIAASQPIMLSVPDSLLQSGVNELVLRIAVDEMAGLAAHGIRVGPADEIRRTYQWQYILQYMGPLMIGAILASASLFAFLFWLMSRDKTTLLWLMALALILAIASQQHVFDHQMIAPNVTQDIPVIAIYLLFPFIIGLGGSIYNDPRRKYYFLAAVVASGLSAITHQILHEGNVIGTWAGAAAGIAVSAYYFINMLKSLRTDHMAILLAVLFGSCSIVHDLGFAEGIWVGLGFPLLPYAALVLIGVFGIAIGRRFNETLATKESQNEMLGMRIETTKANLIASESARRTLEVSNAITSERERMMREIHDGIGSSLMAALASAERQGKQSSTAVVALKSALTDLRIAVDSLDPVEGNVTTLLANLRYRIEPELRKSGIAFEWRVDDVPELDWLDAPNALHILRIFQEALGNTLGHANATKITVLCHLILNGGRPGIVIEVKDNGDGFDLAIPPQGRGRKNMMQRAEALGGKLTIKSEPGQGTETTLWLPLMRTQV